MVLTRLVYIHSSSSVSILNNQFLINERTFYLTTISRLLGHQKRMQILDDRFIISVISKKKNAPKKVVSVCQELEFAAFLCHIVF